MKNKYPLLLFAFLGCCLFSCTKDNSTPPAFTLIGNWNLQQQHVVLTIDNKVYTDTVFNASNVTHANVQFNKDNTFSSAAVYRPNNLSLLNNSSNASSVGTYSYSNNVFTMQPGIAGWFSYAYGVAAPPVILLHTIGIDRLTTSNLDFHTDFKSNYTDGTGAHVNEIVSDFYYTK